MIMVILLDIFLECIITFTDEFQSNTYLLNQLLVFALDVPFDLDLLLVNLNNLSQYKKAQLVVRLTHFIIPNFNLSRTKHQYNFGDSLTCLKHVAKVWWTRVQKLLKSYSLYPYLDFSDNGLNCYMFNKIAFQIAIDLVKYVNLIFLWSLFSYLNW